MLQPDRLQPGIAPFKVKERPNVQFKTASKFPETSGKTGKKRKKPAVCGNLRIESEKSGRSRIRDQKAAANEGSVSPVGSAEGKRPEVATRQY